MRRHAGYAFAALEALLLVCGLSVAAATSSLARPEAKILSASWGTDNAVGCPSGAQDLDNIPVTFQLVHPSRVDSDHGLSDHAQRRQHRDADLRPSVPT
jgi:hypothetical protein